MWSAYDADRVALLVDRGAMVNARTRNSTPLLVATRYGNVAAMRLLIGHGADLKTDATALITEAHTQGGDEVEQVLAAAGLGMRDPKALTTILSAGGGQTLIQVGFPERLLARGAAHPDDNVANRTFNAPLLGYVAVEHGAQPFGWSSKRGANPNARGARGITPLMMARGGARADPQIIRMLLEKGCRVDTPRRSRANGARLGAPAGRNARGAGAQEGRGDRDGSLAATAAGCARAAHHSRGRRSSARPLAAGRTEVRRRWEVCVVPSRKPSGDGRYRCPHTRCNRGRGTGRAF
jgi:ankyrin repeat protein